MNINDEIEFPGPFEGSSVGRIIGFPEPGKVSARGGGVPTIITVPTGTLKPNGPNRWRWTPPWE